MRHRFSTRWLGAGRKRSTNIVWHVLIGVSLVGGIASCANTQQWSEFHGQSSNAGRMDVNTPDANNGRFSFQQLGPIGFSSPVIDQDTVYIADLNGYLWRLPRRLDGSGVSDKLASAPGCTLSSPAIGSDGLIHLTALCVRGASTISQMCRIAPEPKMAVVDCVDLPAGYTTSASPKVWTFGRDTFAFVPAYADPQSPTKRKLLVYRAGELLAQRDIECPYEVIEGGDDDAWKYALAFFTGNWSLIWDRTRPGFKVQGIDVLGPRLQPTIGIHDRGTSTVTLVAAFNGCRIKGFEWSSQTAALADLWTLQKEAAVHYSTPAISPDGSIWIGTSDGHIYEFHAIGGQVWTDFSTEESIIATPAIAGDGSVYVASNKHIYMFRGGERVAVAELPADTAASPAVSLNHVYVAHSVGVSTFDPDLQQSTLYSKPAPLIAWGSSPAIAPDGYLYVALADGRLYTIRP